MRPTSHLSSCKLLSAKKCFFQLLVYLRLHLELKALFPGPALSPFLQPCTGHWGAATWTALWNETRAKWNRRNTSWMSDNLISQEDQEETFPYYYLQIFRSLKVQTCTTYTSSLPLYQISNFLWSPFTFSVIPTAFICKEKRTKKWSMLQIFPL